MLMKPMKTDEEGYNASMSRIPLSCQTILYEILGNIQSNRNGIISFNISEDFSEITIFGQDTWNELDKEALHTKNLSGDNRGTASINGVGIKLILNYLLDKDETAEYTIVDNTNKFFNCKIGHFKHSEWGEIDTDSEDYNTYLKNISENTNICDTELIGTFIHIPIKSKCKDEFKNMGMSKIKKMFNKFYNRLPSIEDKIVIFNHEKQDLKPLSKYNIELNCSIIWDTDTPEASSCRNVLLQFNNYEEIKEYFPKIKPLIKLKPTRGKKDNTMKKTDLKEEYVIIKNKIVKENFIIRFSIITCEESKSQLDFYGPTQTDLRGVQIYYGNRCLTTCGIFKHLGGKQGKDGEGGALGKAKYDGHERFEIELLDKNSELFYLPKDKTNIQPSTYGERILKFIRFLAESYPGTKNKNNFKPDNLIDPIETEELSPNISVNIEPIVEDTSESESVSTSEDVITSSISEDSIDSSVIRHRTHHSSEGGYLYIITLEGDWYDPIRGKIYKCGRTEDIKERLKQYQRHHPIRKIKLIKLYKLSEGLKIAEGDIKAEIDKKKYKYETSSTETSEYFVNLEEVIKIFEDFKNNRWEEISDSEI